MEAAAALIKKQREQTQAWQKTLIEPSNAADQTTDQDITEAKYLQEQKFPGFARRGVAGTRGAGRRIDAELCNGRRDCAPAFASCLDSDFAQKKSAN